MKFSDSVVVCLWDMREVSACKLFYTIPPPEHKLTRQMSDRRMMSCIQTSHWNYASRRLRLCVWRKWIFKKKLYLNENIKTFNVGSHFFLLPMTLTVLTFRTLNSLVRDLLLWLYKWRTRSMTIATINVTNQREKRPFIPPHIVNSELFCIVH